MSTVTVRSESGDTRLEYESGVTLLDVLRAESFDTWANKVRIALELEDGRKRSE